jgi:hypothetical protein
LIAHPNPRHRLLIWFGSRFDPGLIVVVLLPVFVGVALFQPGLPRTADGYLHLLRVVEIDQSWQDGVFYPRWAPDMAFGYGYPIFNYFAPLLYLLSEVVHVPGLGFESALKFVLVGCFVLGAWGTYSLARDIMGPRAGILASAAYVYAPFLLREVFVRGGYAQFLATCIMPAAFWSFYRLATRDQPLYLWTSSFLGGAVIVSHNISGMIFFPVLSLFTFWVICSTQQWHRLKWVVTALALSLALVSFFVVPALAEKPLVKLDRLRQDYFDFTLHFLTLREILSPSRVPDSSSLNPVWLLNLGTAQLALSGLGLAGIALGPWSRERKVQVAFFPLMLAGSVLMMLPLSTVIWENAPLLPFTQFPWRFFSLAILGAAALCGASAGLWERIPWPRFRLAPVLLCLLAIVVISFPQLYPQWPPARREALSPRDVVVNEVRTGIVGTNSASECLPVWVVDEPTWSPLLSMYLSDSPISKLDPGSLPEDARAELVRHTVALDRYEISSPSAATLQFNTFYYPGWEASVDSQAVAIEPSYPEGLITFPVPAGEHTVLVRFGDTAVRLAANLLSAAALLGLIAATAALAIRRRRQPISVATGGRHRGLSLLNAGIAGALLLALLAAKEGIIDQHTTWFRKSSPPGQVLGVQYPSQVNLGDEVLFLGHDVSAQDVVAGGNLQVTLYWEAQRRLDEDYSVFLHLDDLRQNYISWSLSEELSPADIPTSSWTPGFYVSDRHVLRISPETPPGIYVLRTGLYLADTGEKLPVLDQMGDAVSGSVDVNRIRVRQASPVDLSDAVQIGPFVFGQEIELVGYKLDHDSAAQGNYFRLVLYWRARAEIEEDYSVFVHLIGQEGESIAQGDGVPANGIYPTWAWVPGEIIEDEHLIPLETDSPAGTYQLSVGLYQLGTPDRLTVEDTEGASLGDQVLLPPVLEVLAQ